MNNNGYRFKSNGKYWQITWPGLVNAKGKAKWISTGKILGTDATREDVEAYLVELRVKHAANPDAARVKTGGALTIGQWVDPDSDSGYFAYVSGDLTETTLMVQRRAAARLIKVYGSDTAIDSITVEDGKRFWRAMETEGLSVSTICQQVRCAKKFMNTAKKLRKILGNPFEDLRSNPPKGQKRAKPRRALVQEDEVRSVIAADPRLHALLAMCWHMGLRTHEALEVRHCDVDFNNMTMKIRSRKTGDRLVPVSPELFEEMCMAARNWAMSQHGTCPVGLTPAEVGEFAGKDLGLVSFLDEGRHPSSVWSQVNAACLVAGVEPFCIQDLRVARANAWAKDPNVGPVRSARFLGHSERTQENEYREFDIVDMQTVTGVRPGEDRRTNQRDTRDDSRHNHAQTDRKVGDTGLERSSRPLYRSQLGVSK